MTMIPFAGAVFGIFAVILFLGFWLTARNPGARATGDDGTGRIARVLYGVTLIKNDIHYYQDWRAAMLREFDDSVESNLKLYYRLAESVAKHPREEWKSLVEHHFTDTDSTSDPK